MNPATAQSNTYMTTKQDALQACGAYKSIYNFSVHKNEDYWDMKNAGPMTFSTGIRVYKDKGATSPGVTNQ